MNTLFDYLNLSDDDWDNIVNNLRQSTPPPGGNRSPAVGDSGPSGPQAPRVGRIVPPPAPPAAVVNPMSAAPSRGSAMAAAASQQSYASLLGLPTADDGQSSDSDASPGNPLLRMISNPYDLSSGTGPNDDNQFGIQLRNTPIPANAQPKFGMTPGGATVGIRQASRASPTGDSTTVFDDPNDYSATSTKRPNSSGGSTGIGNDSTTVYDDDATNPLQAPAGWWKIQHPLLKSDPFTSVDSILREMDAVLKIPGPHGGRFVDTRQGHDYYTVLNNRLYAMKHGISIPGLPKPPVVAEGAGNRSGNHGGLATDTAHGGDYRKAILAAAAKYHIDPFAVQAIINHETHATPDEVYHNRNGTVDYGIMQVNSGTKDPSTYDWRDPVANIDAGVSIFADKLRRAGGDYRSGFRFYNGKGPAADAYADAVYADYLALKQHPQNGGQNAGFGNNRVHPSRPGHASVSGFGDSFKALNGPPLVTNEWIIPGLSPVPLGVPRGIDGKPLALDLSLGQTDFSIPFKGQAAVSSAHGTNSSSNAPLTHTNPVVGDPWSYPNGREKLNPTLTGSVNGFHFLNPTFADRLGAMMAEAKRQGIPLGMTDGFRPYEIQVKTYNDPKKRTPKGGHLGAVPGTSNHGWGTAADLSGGSKALAWAHQNAARFGLTFPMNDPHEDKYEPWHIELPGAPKRKSRRRR